MRRRDIYDEIQSLKDELEELRERRAEAVYKYNEAIQLYQLCRTVHYDEECRLWLNRWHAVDQRIRYIKCRLERLRERLNGDVNPRVLERTYFVIDDSELIERIIRGEIGGILL